ncbi:MAG: FkbM family methyltransferase [Parcubacteria group bacterium]|nr:FkbM family methyltransferase [Parcubacteria group bacterium]
MRGKKWIKGSGVNSYWLGNYETEKQKLFCKKVKTNDIVFDIGAHVGFYSLLSAELVGKNGKVYAFEPLPRNITYLKKHIELNKQSNIIVIESAVSNKDGMTMLCEEIETPECSIVGNDQQTKNTIQVTSATLDTLIQKNVIPVPNIIKIDVEGAELMVLEGARSLLNKFHPMIVLATHNQSIHNECINFLQSYGYRIDPITGDGILFTDEIFAYYK